MTRAYLPDADPAFLLKPFFEEALFRETLENGLVTVVKPDSAVALVSVQVWVKTGSIHEGECLGSGLSHFVEHMVFKGTRKRLGPQIAAEVQAHGGSMNAYTTFDRTVYYIDIPSEHLDVALDVLADTVFDATLPEVEVDRERDVILREIDMGVDDPDRTLTQALFSTAFREHPYRYPVIGHRQVFEGVGREELAAYYGARYLPNNAVLIVAGDVDPETAREKIGAAFGGFPRRRLAPFVVPYEPEQTARREDRLYRDVNLSRCSLAYKIPGLHHKDAPALDILAAILGNGKSSILWKELREERQLVHDIDAMTWKPPAGGLLGISFTADPDKRAEAAKAVVAVIDEALVAGFSPALAAKSVRQAIVSEINVRKTVSGQGSRLGLAEVVAGDLGFSRAYLQRLAAVDARHLAALGRRYLREEKLTVVSVDPRSSRPASANGRGRAAARMEFREKNLSNGARLLWRPNSRLPNIHLRLVALGGGLYEDPARRGLTSLLATLLTRDTRKRSAGEVSEEIETLGGAFSEFSGNNTFGLALETLPADFDIAVDLLDQAIRCPVFQEDTFRREQNALLAEIREELDDIQYFGMRRLRALFFGDHPLGIDETGTLESVPAIGREDLADHYGRLVRPGNLVLCVAGDLEAAGGLDRLEAFLEELPGEPFAHREIPFAGPPRPGTYREFLPREQAVVLQGFPDCGVTGGDFRVGEVLDAVLSGMASRLFERVREELGLAYYVGAGRVSGLREGMFHLYAGTHPGAAEQVLNEMDAELDRIRGGGVTEEELARCRVRLKARRRTAQQTNASRAILAGLNAVYGLPVNDDHEYDSSIDAVGRDELAAFSQQHLREDQKVSLTVSPEETT